MNPATESSFYCKGLCLMKKNCFDFNNKYYCHVNFKIVIAKRRAIISKLLNDDWLNNLENPGFVNRLL